jgi:hypothetical protein
MNIRRLFWLGAAVLFAIAALIAIGAVLGGHLGRTQWDILGTCAIAFITGSTALAGVACLDRGLVRPVGAAAVALGGLAFVVWTAGLWSEAESEGLWKLAGVVAVWMLAALVYTTLILVASARKSPGWIVVGTLGAAVLAALVGSVMIVAENGDAWQLLAVLVILTLLGYIGTPILQRFSAAGEPHPPAERLLGTIANVDVLAVRGDSRSLRIGEQAIRLDAGEAIVVRRRTR